MAGSDFVLDALLRRRTELETSVASTITKLDADSAGGYQNQLRNLLQQLANVRGMIDAFNDVVADMP